MHLVHSDTSHLRQELVTGRIILEAGSSVVDPVYFSSDPNPTFQFAPDPTRPKSSESELTTQRPNLEIFER